MTPPRVSLLQLPTPLHRLDEVSADLGIDLWIKRDDLTGFAMGGNKGRKLEFLMAAILADAATVVVTCGSTQSNFVRQLGGACAKFRVRCVAVVMDCPFAREEGPPKGKPHGAHGGNVVLDELLGVELMRSPDDDWDNLFEQMEDVARALESQGERVYRIPVGGSSGLGAYGFFEASNEINVQQPAFDRIVVASSSGSTQTGLTLGFHGTETKLIGIACDAEPDLADEFVPIARELASLAGMDQTFSRDSFDLRHDWVGEAYGVPSPQGEGALAYLAKTEGIFLDPVYSAKAFAAVIDLARDGQLPGRTLFWHTGGTPSLFAY